MGMEDLMQLNPRLRTNKPDETKLVVVTDGTSTMAEIVVVDEFGEERLVGRGKARRRKGDRYSKEVGDFLATGRAFKHAYEAVEKHLKENGGYEL